MTVYIALIRGINVGGHHIIKMKDLKTLLINKGLLEVTTYIQSGNILFQSEENAGYIQQLIEDEIKTFYGFSVTVVVRTLSEWEQIIQHCPYPVHSLAEGESVHLALLEKEPSNEAIQHLHAYVNELEACELHGKEIYLFLRRSFHKSKLAIQLQKIGIPTTVRNWKTVAKLELMIREIEKK
ncbi:DUF1697 domain-containing protein [Niallia sp. 03133]|uniref:DUF1697 domain-containing protein n=1 Tax=Niallia sp. 03133 TaxID=3458060 RepID=UPI004044F835